jgi:hypothetical protein
MLEFYGAKREFHAWRNQYRVEFLKNSLLTGAIKIHPYFEGDYLNILCPGVDKV